MLPPAAAGIALLAAFGPSGLLGGAIDDAGIELVLQTAGVVVALVFVAAPFFLRQAIAAFESVDDDLIDASRTLGAGEARTFARVSIPAAGAGLVSGAALAWGRALGEFGATLMFAGSLAGPHADGAAGDLRPARARLHGLAGAVGGARRALGGDPALGQADRPGPVRAGTGRRQGGPMLSFELANAGPRLRARRRASSGAGTLAVMGPSGAGKSSLLRALAGLLRPERGANRARRRDLARHRPPEPTSRPSAAASASSSRATRCSRR